jgi:hypothetical protein
MDKETYLKELKELESEFEKNKQNHAKNYAMANNPYKIGDIITDNIGTIKIDTIQYVLHYFNDPLPQCVYHGQELKKDKSLKKRLSYRTIFQHSILKP